MACLRCEYNYFGCIGKFYDNEEAALLFLQEHCVIPIAVYCANCGSQCTLRKDSNLWRCNSFTKIKKKKKRKYCGFSVSHFKGSFLSHISFPAWKLVIFVNHFLSKHWDHQTVEDCLGFSSSTSVRWRASCSEITDHWFLNQDPIGGPDVIVEIDKTLIVQQKPKQGEVLNQIFLFGGIEKISKKRFVVPITVEDGENPDKDVLIALIKTLILPHSIVVSDAWFAYVKLDELGFQHKMVNQSSENIGNSEESVINTENMKKVWKDIKEWVMRRGMSHEYMYQYLARYLFIISHKQSELLHRFFVEVSKVYRPIANSSSQRTDPPISNNETADLPVSTNQTTDPSLANNGRTDTSLANNGRTDPPISENVSDFNGDEVEWY